MLAPSRDIKTQGIVLRRTNYGEADRILNIITPVGKFGVIARGVRKPKSKLAGGVEMFTLSNVQIHQGRSELGILTGAKMIEYYSEIIKDYEKMQFAGAVLRRVNAVAETIVAEDYFTITKQILTELNSGMSIRLVEAWLRLNLARVNGEEMNVYRDVDGNKLEAGEKYDWDGIEKAFVKSPNGVYGENEIKLLRIMSKIDLERIKSIKIKQDVMEKVCDIIKIWEK